MYTESNDEQEYSGQRYRAEAAEAELRQRELHHFETEQENASLKAELDRLRTSLWAMHEKGYHSISDEVWDHSPVCSCGEAWPCHTACALLATGPISNREANNELDC